MIIVRISCPTILPLKIYYKIFHVDIFSFPKRIKLYSIVGNFERAMMERIGRKRRRGAGMDKLCGKKKKKIYGKFRVVRI